MRTLMLGLVFVASLAMAPCASGQNQWVQWSGNGHFYLAVSRPAGINWTNAQGQAQALGGNLATVTSAAENAFVFGLVSSPSFWRQASNPTRVLGPWLGGFQPAGSAEPRGSWTWVTGETWGTFTNWSSGEPNNWNGTQEDHLQFFSLGTAPGPRWNDLTVNSLMYGFVVEAVVAQPATATQFGAGCGSPTLQINPIGRPLLGTTQDIDVSGVPPAGAFMAMGLSATSYPPLQLPLSLGQFGMGGCTLYQNMTYLSGILASPGPGTATFSAQVPLPAYYLGVTVYLQAWAFDPGANQVGIISSNAIALVLGNL